MLRPAVHHHDDLVCTPHGLGSCRQGASVGSCQSQCLRLFHVDHRSRPTPAHLKMHIMGCSLRPVLLRGLRIDSAALSLSGGIRLRVWPCEAVRIDSAASQDYLGSSLPPWLPHTPRGFSCLGASWVSLTRVMFLFPLPPDPPPLHACARA